MIPKEGDITNCYYYRGISLLSAPGRAQNNTLKIKNAASSGQPAKEQSWKIMNWSDYYTKNHLRAMSKGDLKTQANFAFFFVKVLREFRKTFAEEFC